MKKILIDQIPLLLPEEIERLCYGARIFDSSCSPEAKVYFIDKDEGFYLKCADSGSLLRERVMTEYFHKIGLGARVLGYYSGEGDLLLTARVMGEDCTHEKYKNEPKRLCDLLAEQLRLLHEVDFSDCPVKDRVSEYIARAEKNYKDDNYDKEHFLDSFGYSSGEEAFRALESGKHILKNDVLLHGDYCMPNIMLDDWRFSGFIDVDSAGVGDRHIDLFWGVWSLQFNLGTNEFASRFLDAYGRDKIDTEVLKIVAAAEVLG